MRAPDETVHPDRLREMMGSDSAPLLIDVRQPEEFAEGHIPGALSVPLGQLDVMSERFDPERPIVTYCNTGMRGTTAARLLTRRGFDARTLEGGIRAWPFEKAAGPAKSLAGEEAASAADLLAVAVMREIQAMEYYSLTANRASDAAVKEVLEYLAVMEQGHMDVVYAMYSTAAADQGATPTKLEELRTMATGPVDRWQIGSGQVDVVARSFDVDMSLEDPSDAHEVLEKAVAWEFEAYDFYRRSAEMVEGDKIRSLLVDMAFEERTHANMILRVMGNLGAK